MNKKHIIAIVIPSLNPDSHLPDLVMNLRSRCDYPIILINDGSRQENLKYFNEAAGLSDVILLHHSTNLGKGRALKTGFYEFLKLFPDGIGVCTADGDGQHRPDDIIKCCKALKEKPTSLILGVRDFSLPGIPWKSVYGNTLTRFIFRLAGVSISDTQTGLRGIGSIFLKELTNIQGDRFEWETMMLLDAEQAGIPFFEVPIQTVYLDGNSETHFNPVKDSFLIYCVILKHCFKRFIHFSISGLISFVVDITLYSILFYIIVPKLGLPRLITSVAVARACSLIVNYFLNRYFVFGHAKGNIDSLRSFSGYLILCGLIMGLSYCLTRWFLIICPSWNAVLCKMIADVICFVVSFFVQKKIIFHHRK